MSQIQNNDLADQWQQQQKVQTDWLMGDWDALLTYDTESFQKNPTRAELIILIACAYQQKDLHDQAKKLVKQAIAWGIARKKVAQLLIANIHNTLAERAKLLQTPALAEHHYQQALQLANAQGKLSTAVTQARVNTQPASLEKNLAEPSDEQQKIQMLKVCIKHGYKDAVLEPPAPAYLGSLAGEKRRLMLSVKGKKAIANLLPKVIADKLEVLQKEVKNFAPILARLPYDQQQDIALFEWIEGTLLWEIIEQRPSLESIKFTLEEALGKINQQGLIHGDVRPWNIIWNEKQGQPYLIDWDLSQVVGDDKGVKNIEHILLRGYSIKSIKEVDLEDLKKSIDCLKDPGSLYRAWWHASSEFNYLPPYWK